MHNDSSFYSDYGGGPLSYEAMLSMDENNVKRGVKPKVLDRLSQVTPSLRLASVSLSFKRTAIDQIYVFLDILVFPLRALIAAAAVLAVSLQKFC